MSVPSAYLFANGNAAFLDEAGEQIPELQAMGWAGLYGFVRRYPVGRVHLQPADPVHPDVVPRLLAQVADRDALARLEAWRLEDAAHRGYCLTFDAVVLSGLATADRVVKRRFAFVPGDRTDLVGTDGRPATLAEVVHAALDEWERRFGGEAQP